jgi:Fe-Mn family superoxide dismutase
MESPAASVVLGESIHSTNPGLATSAKRNQPPTSSASGLAPPPHFSNPQNPTTPPLRRIHTTSLLASGFSGIHTAKAVGLHGTDVDGESLDFRENVVNFDNVGRDLYPLFCVSVHEHAWLSAGYGIWGKEEYLKRFWTVLDWEKVSGAFTKFVPERAGYQF